MWSMLSAIYNFLTVDLKAQSIYLTFYFKLMKNNIKKIMKTMLKMQELKAGFPVVTKKLNSSPPSR